MLKKATARRVLLVLLLMCAVVSAQAASLLAEHSHQHSSEHCCRLCHAGPLPFLPSTAQAAVAPDGAVVWLAGSSDYDATPEVLLAAGDSRAPPA